MDVAVTNLIVSIITALIFLGILFLTKEYAKSTKEIANKTAESVKATKEYIEVIGEFERKKYQLERKALCKRLLYEIGDNELSLEFLLNFFESNKPDSFEKIWIYFKNRKYKERFRNEIFKRFDESNIDFIENKIFENINYLYLNLNIIQLRLQLVMSKDKSLKQGVLELFLSEILKPIKESLKIINELYELFKKEIGYDFKESNYYKDKKTMIELFKDLKLIY